MSGLQQFQDSAAWRQKLLNHLLADRPPKKQSKENNVEMDSKEQRYSLDIVEDFQGLMAKRKAERQKNECAKTIINSKSIEPLSVYDGTMYDQDESFDAYERMCDKTSSDPDSTLFQYLNSDDKEHVLAMAKERSTVKERDISEDKIHEREVNALCHIFDNVGKGEQLDNESPIKGVECTQLEDVDAPSHFWDNTLIDNESMFQPSKQTSPVKMVGLMRPSTIIEANEADLTNTVSDTSSQFSFHTALKTAQSSETIASSCYETATNESTTGSRNDGSDNFLNVDDLFYAAIAKAKPHSMLKSEEQELLNDLHVSLMDQMAQKTDAESVDDTVIELSSSDNDTEEELTSQSISIKQEHSPTARFSTKHADNKENEPDKSLNFNDTMEEMEYMMQKGLEYMAAAAPQANTGDAPQIQKQNTFVVSPKVAPSAPASPSVAKFSSPLRCKNKVPPKSDSSKKQPQGLPERFEINMALPKTKFFKQPSGIPTRRQLDIKQPYAHIISPIRAYTQKSGTAPLMTMFRQTHTDAFKTMAFSELEQEARLCQFKYSKFPGDNSKGKVIDIGIAATARILPKKAYISSELKHIVDERTPMPMPNVPKIQKYLNSAVEPTVLRHDGKIKMPGAAKNQAPVYGSQLPRRPNQSLADLSLASGDISMYTIKDAQKF